MGHLSTFAQANKETEKELREKYQGKLVEVRLPKGEAEGPKVDLPKEMRAFVEEGSLPTIARVEKLHLEKKSLETEIRFVLFYRDGKELREALSQRWKLRLRWDDPHFPGNEIMAAASGILVPANPDPVRWENYWPPEPQPRSPDQPTGPRPSREIAPGVFTGGTDMVLPECASCPNPDFPREARDHSYGQVILMTVINEQGRPRGVFIKRADPAGYGFEDAAVWAVSRWRFKPGMRSGKPVSVLMTIELSFRRF